MQAAGIGLAHGGAGGQPAGEGLDGVRQALEGGAGPRRLRRVPGRPGFAGHQQEQAGQFLADQGQGGGGVIQGAGRQVTGLASDRGRLTRPKGFHQAAYLGQERRQDQRRDQVGEQKEQGQAQGQVRGDRPGEGEDQGQAGLFQVIEPQHEQAAQHAEQVLGPHQAQGRPLHPGGQQEPQGDGAEVGPIDQQGRVGEVQRPGRGQGDDHQGRPGVRLQDRGHQDAADEGEGRGRNGQGQGLAKPGFVLEGGGPGAHLLQPEEDQADPDQHAGHRLPGAAPYHPHDDARAPDDEGHQGVDVQGGDEG